MHNRKIYCQLKEFAFAPIEVKMKHPVNNVAPGLVPNSYVVRFWLNGEKRIFGVTDRLHDAARFADMVNLYLIQRGLRTLRKTGYNFSEEQAKLDLETSRAVGMVQNQLNTIYPDGIPEPRFHDNAKKGRFGSLRYRVEKLEKQVEGLLNASKD